MSVHEAHAHQLLSAIIEDPGATSVLAQVRRWLASRPGDPHRLDRDYVDAIGQVHMSRPARWPMEQVAAFTRIHAGLVGGSFGHIRIGGPNLTGGPGRDADRVGNAAMLANLNGPFIAEVDLAQNNADQDGTLYWEEPARCERAVNASYFDPCSKAGMRRLVTLATIEPGQAPLEIGSSSPSRTLFHLLQDGAVARWPYGADWITLFINFEQGWAQDRLEDAPSDLVAAAIE